MAKIDFSQKAHFKNKGESLICAYLYCIRAKGLSSRPTQVKAKNFGLKERIERIYFVLVCVIYIYIRKSRQKVLFKIKEPESILWACVM